MGDSWYMCKYYCGEEYKEKAKNYLKAVCQENSAGVICCPSTINEEAKKKSLNNGVPSNIFLCDKEGYRECKDVLMICSLLLSLPYGQNDALRCFKRPCLMSLGEKSCAPFEPQDPRKFECIDHNDGYGCCKEWVEGDYEECYPPYCYALYPNKCKQ